MLRMIRWALAPLLSMTFVVAPAANATNEPETPLPARATTPSSAPAAYSAATLMYSVNAPRGIDADDPQTADGLQAAKDFIALQRTAWEDKQISQYWSNQYQVAREKIDSMQTGLQIQEEETRLAQEKAKQSRGELARWLYRTPGAMGENPRTLDVFMAGSQYAEKLLQERQDSQLKANALAERLGKAEADKEAAEKSQAKLNDMRQTITKLSTDAERYRDLALKREASSREAVQEAQQGWSKALLDAAQKEPGLGARMLETALTDEWNTLVEDLAELNISIPSIEDLQNTNTYPEGFSPVQTMHPRDRTGVASKSDTTVPSKESLKRVSWALKQVGKPYVTPEAYAAADAPEGFSCDAFTAKALGSKKVRSLDHAYEKAGRQNMYLASTAPGDIVFFANPASGIHQAGVYVMGGFVVTASAATGTVGIERIGADAIASVRPGLDSYGNSPAPAASEDEDLPQWTCGSVEGSLSGEEGTAFGWHRPLMSDDYTVGAKFEDADERFSTRVSPGLELLASKEQTVHAPFDGIVVEAKTHPDWGNTIVIEHESGLLARYAYLNALSASEGTQVASGQAIATIGVPGSNTPDTTEEDEPETPKKKGKKAKKSKKKGGEDVQNPLVDFDKHQYGLMITVEASGMNINPEHLVFPVVQEQYANGRIPASALCKISVGGLLRCDAARSFEMLAAAYKEHFGTPISLTDTYRSLEGQIRCRATKGNMCAVPGTSNHGWGIAIDFSGGINQYDTPQHRWMVENAGKFGWYLPGWAQKNGSLPEPWHWEFQRN